MTPKETAKRNADPKRKEAFLRGVSAEGRASLYLAAKGYRTLAKRWRSPAGEIDLVVKRGKLVVFVEVKTRADLDTAAESVLPRQRKRITAAAEAWLATHPEHMSHDLRFDAVLIAPKRLPRHIEAAFDAEY
ncbi:MAG: YraN family protein [Rhizobiales bacterium]|jgi:putative endonuclease|nr:YraN family protein [Hyphomicrobiales bacterium]